MNKTVSVLKIAIAAATFAFAASSVGATTTRVLPISERIDQTSGVGGSIVSAASASYYVVP